MSKKAAVLLSTSAPTTVLIGALNNYHILCTSHDIYLWWATVLLSWLLTPILSHIAPTLHAPSYPPCQLFVAIQPAKQYIEHMGVGGGGRHYIIEPHLMMTYEPFDPPVDELYAAWSTSCLRTPLVLAAQARGVLDSTPSDCRPFHFSLFLPHEV